MSEIETHQPTSKSQMSFRPTELVKDVGKEYVESAGKEAVKTAGEKTVEYTQTAQGQQQIDDAKAEAEGLWAKYCGCFSS